MNSVESRLNALLEEFIAFDNYIVAKHRDLTEAQKKIKNRDFGDKSPKECVKDFTKNNMELTELSLTVEKILDCIKELNSLCKLNNPEFKPDEKYAEIVKSASNNVLYNFGVVNGQVTIINPDYERLLNEHLDKEMTPEKVESILNSPLFKAS